MSKSRLVRGLVAVAGAGAIAALGAAPAQAASSPDLHVTGVDFSAAPTVGSPVTFSATITNKGTAATPAGVIHGVQFKVDGKMTTWSDTSTASLKPGQSRTVVANYGPARSAAWTATTGTHTVTAEVDDARRIAEAAENNNILTRSVTPAPLSSSVAVVATGSGSWLQVSSTMAPLAAASYLESELHGRLSAACFTNGVVVPGTGKSLGEVTIGDVAGGTPWYNSGYYIDAVAEASTTSVVADVVLKAILRDRAGELAGVSCRPGSTAGFHQWKIDSLSSVRHTMAGAPIASATRTVSLTYSFPQG